MSKRFWILSAALLLVATSSVDAQVTPVPGSDHDTACRSDPDGDLCKNLTKAATLELQVRAAGALASDAASAVGGAIVDTAEAARLALGGTPLGGGTATATAAPSTPASPWAGLAPPMAPVNTDPYAQPMDRLQRTEAAIRLVERDRALTDELRQNCRPAALTPACPEIVGRLNTLIADYKTFNANPTTARQDVKPLQPNAVNTAKLIGLQTAYSGEYYAAPNGSPAPTQTEAPAAPGTRVLLIDTLPGHMIRLSGACGDERRAAISEAFGANATMEMGVALDQRLALPLASTDAAQLAEQYQVFDDTGQQTRTNPSANAYARCLYGERLKEIDPKVDLAAVGRGEYPPDDPPAQSGAWAAALSRQGGAGTSVLAASADPTQRAQLQAKRDQEMRDRNMRVAQNRSQSGGFWSGLFQIAAQAAVIGLESYAAVQQAQAAANASQAYAQTYANVAPALAPQPQYRNPLPNPVAMPQAPDLSRTHNPANVGTHCVVAGTEPTPGGLSVTKVWINKCPWPVAFDTTEGSRSSALPPGKSTYRLGDSHRVTIACRSDKQGAGIRSGMCVGASFNGGYTSIGP